MVLTEPGVLPPGSVYFDWSDHAIEAFFMIPLLY